MLLERILTDYEIKPWRQAVIDLLARTGAITMLLLVGSFFFFDSLVRPANIPWFFYYAVLVFLLLVFSGLLFMRHFGPIRRHRSFPYALLQNDQLMVDLYMAGFRAADLFVIAQCMVMHRTRKRLKASRAVSLSIFVLLGAIMGAFLQFGSVRNFNPWLAVSLSLYMGVIFGIIAHRLDFAVGGPLMSVGPGNVEAVLRLKARGLLYWQSWQEFKDALWKAWETLKRNLRRILYITMIVVLITAALILFFTIIFEVWGARGIVATITAVAIFFSTALAWCCLTYPRVIERGTYGQTLKMWRKSLQRADQYYEEFVNKYSENPGKKGRKSPTFYGPGGKPKSLFE